MSDTVVSGAASLRQAAEQLHFVSAAARSPADLLFLGETPRRMRGADRFDEAIGAAADHRGAELLKSCATPPARRSKIASIFCAWT